MRIGRKVGRLFDVLKSTLFGTKEIPKEIKTQIYQKAERPSLIYGSKSWNKRKVKAMEMRFLRRQKGSLEETE